MYHFRIRNKSSLILIHGALYLHFLSQHGIAQHSVSIKFEPVYKMLPSTFCFQSVMPLQPNFKTLEYVSEQFWEFMQLFCYFSCYLTVNERVNCTNGWQIYLEQFRSNFPVFPSVFGPVFLALRLLK